HVNPVTRQTIDQSASGKLRDLNAEESWALLEDLALYNNESWNDPRDFAKPFKAIALPQDVPSTSDRRLIELKNEVQCLMKAHLAPTQPTQVNKITTSCKICSGHHDTRYCMKDPGHASIEYASSRDSMASKNTASISYIEREELRRKGIKIPSKLFSPNEESEAEEGETTTDITPEHGHNITKEAKDEVNEVMEKDKSEVETDWEVEEILEDEEREEED
ncbi:hypothetical protein Tco_1251435, partial [Tanacetum coccineum]